MAGNVPSTPPPSGQPIQTGFYSLVGGPFGGSLTLAGILMAGFMKIVNELLHKAGLTSAQLGKLTAIEKKVDELIQLLSKVQEKGKLPASLGKKIEALIGTSAKQPGELGKLIEGLGATATESSLETQLEQVRRGLTGGLVNRIKTILADIEKFKVIWVHMVESKGEFGKQSLVDLAKDLSKLSTDMTWMDDYLKAEPGFSALRELKDRLDKLFKGVTLGVISIKDLIEGCHDVYRKEGSHTVSAGGSDSPAAKKFKFWVFMLEMVLSPSGKGKHRKPPIGIPGLGRDGSYSLINEAISDAKGVAKSKFKPNIQSLLEEVHRVLDAHPGSVNMIAQGYWNAWSATQTMVNTCEQMTPDMITQLKAETDQINQLLTQLNGLLKTTNRIVDTAMAQIRPKG